MVQQYLRKFNLVAIGDDGEGIALSDLQIKFAIHHGTYLFPHTADIKVLNLGSETQNRFAKEFTKIQVLAGYEGNYGLIFQGGIKQVQKGWEETDTFINIHAADGDSLHNFGVVNKTLQAGYTQEQVWQTITDTVAPYNKTAPLSTLPKQTSGPRGKVMYGPVHDTIQDWSKTNQQLVTVDNGILTAMPLLAFKPGEAIVINRNTGMVGAPEQTADGITVTCLLNPALQWSSRVQLNNAEITQNLVPNTDAGFLQQTTIETKQNPVIFPDLSADGMYKVLTVDHVGETRGNAWYSRIICIAVDSTTAFGEVAADKAAKRLGVIGTP